MLFQKNKNDRELKHNTIKQSNLKNKNNYTSKSKTTIQIKIYTV